MPLLRTYRVFISHAWHRGEHYRRIVEWLDAAPHFKWENLSVPEHDPVDNDALDKELRDEMRPADVFVILAGMYVAHSEVIAFELKWARILGKPIVAIRPQGNIVLPADVQRQADIIVGWNSASVVQAIRDYALAAA
jgi:hypothetical protein